MSFRILIILTLCLISCSTEIEETSIKLLFNSPLYLDSPSEESSSVIGKSLVQLINESNQSIHFAIYGIRNQSEVLNALLQAKNRGVEVYGIVDKDLSNNNYYSGTEELIEKLEGIKDDYQSDKDYEKNNYQYVSKPYWEKPLGFDGPPSTVGYSINDQMAMISVQASRNIISFQGNIMHNKFFVFDKEKVWTGSTNVSDSGTGGYNANISAVIESEEIASIYIAEFNQMHQEGKFHNAKLAHPELAKYNENHKVKVYFSPQTKVLTEEIIPIIDSAEETINVSVFFLTHKGVTGALIEAHRRGVEVRVIIDASGASNEYTKFQFLRIAGIPLKIENWGGKLHSKAASIDENILIIGSMNWTSAGENINDENTLIIHDSRLVEEYDSFFNEMWHFIPDVWLNDRPSAESPASITSCFDGIDNNYDDRIDSLDLNCKNQSNIVNTLPPIYIVKKEEGSRLIKGNISKNGTKIYHLPNQKYYNSVKIDLNKGEYFFANENEARKLGFRKSKT